MLGILLLALFELFGCLTARAVFRKSALPVRLWLGLVLGLVFMMWFPSLFAFVLDFTVAAQICALVLAGFCAAAAAYFSRGGVCASGGAPWKLIAALALPLLAFSVYLELTHTLEVDGGALHVGQSTYGDLCLHLGIATGLRGAAYPPTYTLLQGAQLGYPFLSDAMCASMLLFGTSLRAAFVVTGALMLALVYCGYIMLAWELTKRRFAVVIAFLLMFINGGLGFIYVFDMLGTDQSALKAVFEGFYQTPTNMPALNLRWVNVICDMLVPQRTLLAGWTLEMPALWLLVRALKTRRREYFACLGVLAGAMPMIHTHSFLALGLISLGAMIFALIKTRGREIENFLIYGIIAVALAAPQLFLWTFPQTSASGALKIWFNWVNNDGALIDGYFWFWIKNVGPAYILIIPAALSAKNSGRALAFGALFTYIAAETVLFQTNPYDNNKLFYVAYIAVTPLIGAFIAKLWDRLRGLKCRALFLAVFLIVSTLSGALSLAREAISDYQLFSASEALAGEYIDENTDRDAVFLTGNQHNNPVTTLAGRQIVCGTGSYLFFHGIDYSRQQRDERLMLSAPAENLALFEQYGVDYVYISSYERGAFDADESYFAENCALLFSEGGVSIYEWTNPDK